jgi:hypothetical protein
MSLKSMKACLLAACLSLAACGSERGGEPQSVAGAQIGTGDTSTGAPVETALATDSGTVESAAGEIDEEAVAVLKRMTDTLAALDEFSLTMETGFDVTQPNGEKLEFGSLRTASVRRPDSAHFSFAKRSGEGGELVFDGTDIWAYDRRDNVYATIPQPGDIDAALDFATTDLGIPVPVSDFFTADPSISLASGVLAARDLGPSTIGGRAGRHIALRKPGVNYQIWVSDEDSLPTRFVITYTEDPGQPQFWAQFTGWETQPAGHDLSFRFAPPEGAERIQFATYDSSDVLQEEAVQ